MKITPSYIPIKEQSVREIHETLIIWRNEYRQDLRRCYIALDQEGLTIDERQSLINGIKSIEKVLSQIEHNLKH